MISVERCHKRYGPVVALRDVSFEVERGEIVGLLGHNGAGKTTMMKILTGYIDATEGRVTVGGLDLTSARNQAQSLMGYLPENAPLYPEMLVQEYLLMMANLRAIPKAMRLRYIADAVYATGLEKWLNRRISTLSKGYRQRVGLAGAILHKPKVLVLDEPTNGLDPVQIIEIRQLIKTLAQEATILLSTHILQEIEAVCDRALILVQGQLVADRQLDQLLNSTHLELSLQGEAPTKMQQKLSEHLGLQVAEGIPDSHHKAYWSFQIAAPDAQAERVQSIIELAANAGWKIAAISHQRPSLEGVFRKLVEAQSQVILNDAEAAHDSNHQEEATS